jgi:hypothetical protein
MLEHEAEKNKDEDDCSEVTIEDIFNFLDEHPGYVLRIEEAVDDNKGGNV